VSTSSSLPRNPPIDPAMTNNDVLRRIRYTFDFSDEEMMALFTRGGRDATRAEVSDWLKRDEDAAFQPLADVDLARFLDGLIIAKRGPRPGPPRPPETTLTNNIILAKLRIALSLRSEDVIELLASAGFVVSAHELSALARKPSHRSYRPCQDQLLRKLLQGIQARYRDGEPEG